MCLSSINVVQIQKNYLKSITNISQNYHKSIISDIFILYVLPSCLNYEKNENIN